MPMSHAFEKIYGMIRIFKNLEWSTLSLMAGCYGLWILLGMAWQLPYGWLVLPFMAYLAAFHTSLQHEVVHGHPTPWAGLNEFLVSLPLAAIFPYRRYRELHLQHHNDQNLTDPYEDPESYFWPLSHYVTMRPVMRKIFAINNTFFGRLTIGPALSLYGFSRTEIGRIRRGEPGVLLAWVLHSFGVAAMLLIVTQVFHIPLWVYGLFIVYPALSLMAMRSYAEHQAAENIGERSAIVETCPLWALLYLNNNLHITHHASPTTPWYELPALYAERRVQYLAANGNTLFDGYWEIARRFGFTVKQPVDHPFMHRELDD
ncbi:MAG: fatty acid desaturase [Hyphomicrobiales bacterium]|nr:MAG: fatty acid desaturase [Hyphomicrobiales bacterium]